MTPTFRDLGVPADLVAALTNEGIDAPFDIQAATLPDALAGKDVSGRAPTGSGKTLAYGIAAVAVSGKARTKRPRVLILVPTRELAAQVKTELHPLARARGRTIGAIYGGAGMGPQKNLLISGCDIVVACPGRLADLISQNKCRLDEVDLVVVDEADRMADMGFLPEVRRLLDQCRPGHQTLLFSATLDGEVDVLVRNYQHDPVRYEVESHEDEPVLNHLSWEVERPARIDVVTDIVNRSWPAIVFVRTRHGADRVARQMNQRGVQAVAIHGDRSQNQRERALSEFSSGRAQALVATDVAARGIHVDGVRCVVHFDVPADDKDFVHRSGRTGRAGAAGIVVSLIAREERKVHGTRLRKLGIESDFGAPDMAELAEADGAPARPRPQPLPASVRDGRSRGGRPAQPGRNGQKTRSGQPGRPGRPGGAPTGGTGGAGGAGSAGSRRGKPKAATWSKPGAPARNGRPATRTGGPKRAAGAKTGSKTGAKAGARYGGGGGGGGGSRSSGGARRLGNGSNS